MNQPTDIEMIRNWHESGDNPSLILDRLHTDASGESAVQLLAAAFEFADEDRQIASDYLDRKISAFDADKELLKAIGLYAYRNRPYGFRDRNYDIDDHDLEPLRQKYREGLAPIEMFDYFVVHRMVKDLDHRDMEIFFEQAFYLGSGESRVLIEYFQRECLPLEDINLIMEDQIDERRPEWDIHFYQRPIRYPTVEEINSLRRTFESGVSATDLVTHILDNRLIDPPGLYLMTETFMLAFELPQYEAILAWTWKHSSDLGQASARHTLLTESITNTRTRWFGKVIQISKRRLTLDEEKELQADFLKGQGILEIVDKIVKRPFVDPTLDTLVMSALVDAFRISQGSAWELVQVYQKTHPRNTWEDILREVRHEIRRRIPVWS